MKRRHLFRTALLGLTVMAVGAPAAAAGTSISAEQLRQNGIYMVVSGADMETLRGKLEELGVDCSGWNLSELKQFLQDCNLSGLPEINVPETPDTNTPETDSETPDTNAPETDSETPDQTSFAMQVIQLVNQERAKEGLAALTFDAQIAQAALVRAKETEISFSHTRPNGTPFSTVLTESGVTFSGAGENIAWGQKSPEEVMQGWMNSPGHRANIMNPKFKKIGVGYYQNSKGVNYWTQLFTY